MPSPPGAIRAAALPMILMRLPAAVALGALIFLALTLPKAIEVWRSGMFFNPDDAMRAVEVRDFRAGQGWFDLVPHRLSPAHPFEMHWSRLVDLGLALFNRLFETATDAATAERLTRLVEPSLLALVFLSLAARLGRNLVGRSGALVVALLAAGSLDLVSDFIPGHIHHHGLQLVLLFAMVESCLDGLDPARPGRLGLAGVAAALSLGVNLQNMPFVAVAGALLVLAWVRDGAAFDRHLRWFALGLGAGGAGVFLAQVPPDRYGEATCDAFAMPHLLAIFIFGLVIVPLTCGSSRLRTRPRRLAAATAAGGALVGVVMLTYPNCLGDPYRAVDPLLQTLWLHDVSEAMPLGRLLLRDPAGTIPILIVLLLGLAATALAAVHSRGLARDRWLLLGVLCAAGFAGSCWEIRVAASAEALGLCGCAYALERFIAPRLAQRQFGALACLLAGLLFTQAGWTAALPNIVMRRQQTPAPAVQGLPTVDPMACFAPDNFADLKALPKGLVLSTIDSGAHILAYTVHDVLAAPYHRDSAGIRLALLAFAATPQAARPMIAASGADSIALCTTSPEVHDVVRDHPEGLAAAVLRGAVPAWLSPVPQTHGPYRLFTLQPVSR
jgi:hypothetical protein